MNPRRPTPEDLKSLWTPTVSTPSLIDYKAVKDDFTKWLLSQGLNWPHHIKKLLGYLNRFAKPIKEPMDLIALFEGLNKSQKRHLANSLRKLFNFYEIQGLMSKNYLDILRKNLPKIEVGIDLRVPQPEEIVKSLKVLNGSGRIFALYNLMIDSGLRLTEGVKLYNSIVSNDVEIEQHEGFHVIPLSYFRNTKLAYYGFITDYSLRMVKLQHKTLKYKKVSGCLTKKFKGIVTWKYLRKFANDIMTSEKLNIPESVADFIEGRVPRTVGARHYMKLKRKAIEFYPRYSRYVEELREKAGLHQNIAL